jgi:hypothetical protein
MSSRFKPNQRNRPATTNRRRLSLYRPRPLPSIDQAFDSLSCLCCVALMEIVMRTDGKLVRLLAPRLHRAAKQARATIPGRSADPSVARG